MKFTLNFTWKRMNILENFEKDKWKTTCFELLKNAIIKEISICKKNKAIEEKKTYVLIKIPTLR